MLLVPGHSQRHQQSSADNLVGPSFYYIATNLRLLLIWSSLHLLVEVVIEIVNKCDSIGALGWAILRGVRVRATARRAKFSLCK